MANVIPNIKSAKCQDQSEMRSVFEYEYAFIEPTNLLSNFS